MREYLFRAKEEFNGEWHIGHDIMQDTVRDEIYLAEPGEFWVEVIPETFGQYINKTDKNGKKIFEHDIIRYNDALFVIKYSDEHARFLAVLDNGVFNPAAIQNGEVIGNIFDNPELMAKDGGIEIE